MKRDAFTETLRLDLGRELIIDNFAGGGGTSTGLEAAFGRPVDIAINHDPEALAMHALNHPKTLHLCESVWEVDPIQITGNRPVALVWLSPDCKHFSKAKGGTPVDKNIRGLAWVGMRWAALTKPRCIAMENVEEIQGWGPLIVGEDGKAYPDPAKKGKFFQSFVRQLRAHGYQVDWRELRACDSGAPTIRKRLFLLARRDGLPIVWPQATHGEPTSREVIAGKLMPYRTAAECIDFSVPARSVFGRKKPLAANTMRRVAKGLWRHVLATASPFIVEPSSAGGDSELLTPFLSEHANGSTQRNMAANEPMRTICGEVKGGHFSVIAPRLAPVITTNTTGHAGSGMGSPLPTITPGGNHAVTAAALAPLRGTSPAHHSTHTLAAPLSTVSAGGTHHALMGAHLVTIGYGEKEGQEARTQEIQKPVGTVVAGGVKQALVAAHLVDMGHGESSAKGATRWSHGVRSLERPLNTVTASGATSAISAAYMTKFRAGSVGHDLHQPMHTVTANSFVKRPGGSVPMGLVAACLEQANGGFYDGDGRPLDAPLSTVLGKGANQRLISAYCVRLDAEMPPAKAKKRSKHAAPQVHLIKVPASALTAAQRKRAKECAALLHQYLPEHFPKRADLVIVGEYVLLDITLRMLKPRELFHAQGFPASYVIEEIPDPAILFRDGVQAADPLSIPRIPLTATAQVRMCGNSVSPLQAEALIRANFAHELLIYGRQAA